MPAEAGKPNRLTEMNLELMHMQLYGGPADGCVLPFPLKEPGATYLVRMPREDADGMWDVLAYVEAGRTDAEGRMVLRYERHVGMQGEEKVPSEK